ncbi:OVARIAN TUMOR DOMAIN-containing deubiquitinating enzyme 4-like isoform X2 [Telopea speciosissima]|uniref:OVARIAN TUMOR DOMAIN-containing deubiquitinating enzyme 4-like isoform X2 n=1 Tax=Telopea speciosissima TaxID=54955 RepID=UPI001CC7C149|nr:OVARIAN TUMOR DOMAIN-containing deubiquitinating enzyme 4-like isoform X2 [Telopea speciosissima]
MISCSPITTCVKHVVYLSRYAGKQKTAQVYAMVSQSQSNTCCFYFHGGHSKPRYAGLTISANFSKWRRNWHPLTIKSSANSSGRKMSCLGISSPCQNICLRLLVPRREMCAKVRWNFRPTSPQQGGTSAGLIFGLLVFFSSSNPIYAAVAKRKKDHEDDYESSVTTSSHGKKVYMDYSITGIPGDGRCLFRSVAHGACLRSGKPSPSESLQKELADELRARVADEFVKRREETEWFVEGDFDTYVSQIRKPHVWGGEPELFMASHVLKMPITVYMHDKDAGGLITIAEYGQEYGKEDPIRVLYHGFGHYDALQIPGKKGVRSRPSHM